MRFSSDGPRVMQLGSQELHVLARYHHASQRAVDPGSGPPSRPRAGAVQGCGHGPLRCVSQCVPGPTL